MESYLFQLNSWALIRLGWVIGATILVYLLTVILSQIEFIPILGEWAASLIEQIDKFDK